MLKLPLLFSSAQHPKRAHHVRLRTVKFFLSACLFLSVTVLTTGHVAAQLQNGLVGYWSFDEGRGTTAGDSSGSGNTGTLMNGPIWVSGKSGMALSFDGVDDYVDIPEAESLNLTSALTISAWINNQAPTDSSLSQDHYRIIASKGWAGDNTGSWTLAWRINDGSLFFFAGRATSSRNVSFPYDNSRAGTWHLVTAVLDNGTLSLYQDGVLQAGPVGIDSSKIRTDTSPVLIGSSPVSNNRLNNWYGFIDEVRYYSRALSADEIASLYQQDNQPFNFSLANSMDLSVAQGASATNTITANLVTGSPETISFSAAGLPSGASASFSQKTCSPTCSSLLTITTASSTPTGTYTITVTGTSGEVTKTTNFTLTVNASGFDFSLSNDGNKSVTPGQATASTITATLSSGSSQAVTFSTAGLPTGATASYTTSTSCNPTCFRTLNIATAASTPTGTSTITVTAAGGGVTKTTSFTLTVTSSTATAIISPAQGTTFAPGQTVTATGSGTNLSWDIDLWYDGLPSFETGTGSSITFTVPAYADSSQFVHIVLTGDSGSVTRDYNITNSPTFDFSLSNDGNKSVTPGQATASTITATLSSGSSQAVTFSTAGLPTGATASYTTSTSCNPTCSRTLNIATAASTPTGTSTITVTAAGGGVTKTTSFTLTVNSSTRSITTNIADGAVLSGSAVLWTATPSDSPIRVDFFIDGALLWTEGIAPYQFNGDPSGTLNTTTLSNSSHQLKVRATYSDNTMAERAVNVTVSNGTTSTPAFDFSLSNSGNISVTAGSSVANTINTTLVSGSAQSITFSGSGLPTGTTASFSPASCSPTCSSTLTINTSSSTPAASSTITVTATGGGVTKTTTFSLTVNSPTTTPTPAPAQLTLSWQDNSDNEDSFTIERKTGTNGTYNQIALVSANITSYVDTAVTSGVTYCYRVDATNSAGASAYTNEACGTVP
jgi:hypothetical protein